MIFGFQPNRLALVQDCAFIVDQGDRVNGLLKQYFVDPALFILFFDQPLLPAGCPSVILSLVLRFCGAWASIVQLPFFPFVQHVPACLPPEIQRYDARRGNVRKPFQCLANNGKLISLIPESA
jgi:hypothetical protein